MEFNSVSSILFFVFAIWAAQSFVGVVMHQIKKWYPQMNNYVITFYAYVVLIIIMLIMYFAGTTASGYTIFFVGSTLAPFINAFAMLLTKDKHKLKEISESYNNLKF